MSLTAGAVNAMFHNTGTHNPVVQVLDVRAVTGAVGTRYRCAILFALSPKIYLAHPTHNVFFFFKKYFIFFSTFFCERFWRTRRRVVLSDGMFFIRGMLATQLNHLVESGQLRALTLLRLTELVINNVLSKTIVIVLNADVVGQSNERIGEPQAIDGGGDQPQAESNSNESSSPVDKRRRRPDFGVVPGFAVLSAATGERCTLSFPNIAKTKH